MAARMATACEHADRAVEALGLCRSCYQRQWYHANQRRGGVLLPRKKGEDSPTWQGGRTVWCSVCGDDAGFRSPGYIKKNKYGFTCKKHRFAIKHTRLATGCGHLHNKKYFGNGLCEDCWKLKELQRTADLRAMSGAMPLSKSKKHLHHNWRGGRDVYCTVCNGPAGWKSPAEIKRRRSPWRCMKCRGPQACACSICGDIVYKTPSHVARTRSHLCKKHLNNVPKGMVVNCAICGRSVGWKKPYSINKNKYGFFCESHQKQGRDANLQRRWKGRERTGGQVACGICGADAGYRERQVINKNKYGFLCKAHRGQQEILRKSRKDMIL